MMAKTFKMIAFKAESHSKLESQQENIAQPPPNPNKKARKNLKEFCDLRKRRIITKDSLLEDNDTGDVAIPAHQTNIFQLQQWKEKQFKNIKPNKLQVKLDKALSHPLKISKAESMMQKMGWDGGALGRTGDGILEPITPNLAYATKQGFGQEHTTVKKKQAGNVQVKLQKRQKKLQEKAIFKVNVLKSILQFVRDETEVEVLFDCTLHNGQRKNIHTIIQELRETGTLKASKLDVADLIINIAKFNRYLLMTQSEGSNPNRYLCLYKEAPDYMYLVTHYDLRDEPRIVQPPQPKNKYKYRNKKNKGKKQNVQDDDDDFIETDYDDEDMSMFDDYENCEESVKVSDSSSGIITNASVNEVSVKQLSIGDQTTLDDKTNEISGNNMVTDDTVKIKEIHELSINKSKQKDKSFDVNEAYENEIVNISDDDDYIVVKQAAVEGYQKNKKIKLSNETTEEINGEQDKKDETNDVIIIIDSDDSRSILDVNELYTDYADKKAYIRSKILHYFSEFVKDSKYTEFKFLGDFEDHEAEVVNEFIKNIWFYNNDELVEDDEFVEALSMAECEFTLKEDCNGSTVIHKINNGSASSFTDVFQNNCDEY